MKSAQLETLVEEFLPVVRVIARKVAKRWPNPVVTYDDLVSVGCLAILRAAPRHDPAKGASLKTFLKIRIQGAMLDELRDLDWIPRSARESNTALQLVGMDFKEGDARKIVDPTPGPLAQLLTKDLSESILTAIEKLPFEHRMVISLYYYEELELTEIGEIFGFTDSRASQIHREALIWLSRGNRVPNPF